MAYNGRKRADDCLILALASGMTVAAASERCRVCSAIFMIGALASTADVTKPERRL